MFGQRKWRRAAAVGAVAITAALALTGCGRSGAEAGDAGPTPLSSGAPTGTIAVWTTGGQGPQIAGLVDQFKAQYAGVKVNVTDVPWAEINNKLTNAIAAGTVPDLVLTGEVAPFIPTGGLQQVPDGVVDMKSLYEPSLKRSQDQKGTQYGVPWNAEVRMLWYNKALAAAVGQTSAPTTWDNQLAFFEALKKAPNVTHPVGLPVGGINAYQTIMPFFAQAGGHALTSDSKGWDLGGKPMVDALTYYKKFFDMGLASTDGFSDNAIEVFASGQVPATFQGQYLAPLLDAAIKKAKGIDGFSEKMLDAAPVAAGSAGNASYLGGSTWIVPTDAKNADGAWKFVRWMMQPAQQLEMSAVTQNLPTLKSTWKDPKIADDRWNSIAVQQLSDTIADVPVPTWAQVFTVINNESEKVARGTSSPEDAAAAIQKQAEKIGLGW